MNLKSRDPKIKMENGKSINLKYREINKISNAVDKLQAANGIRTVFPNNNEDEHDNEQKVAKDILNAPQNIHMQQREHTYKKRALKKTEQKSMKLRSAGKGVASAFGNATVNELSDVDDNVGDLANKGRTLMKIPDGVRRAKNIKKSVAKRGEAKRAATSSIKVTKVAGKAAAKIGQAFSKAVSSVVAALGPIGALIAGVVIFLIIIFMMIFTLSGADEGEGDGITSGQFMWPTPQAHIITSGPGPRWGRYHEGIDISDANCYGTPVLASDGGVVVVAGWEGGYGNCVVIKHSNDYYTRYGHMPYGAIRVRVGQKVSKGQQIGAIGNTGRSTGPHLHFEIRTGGIYGKVLDPEKFVFPDD